MVRAVTETEVTTLKCRWEYRARFVAALLSEPTTSHCWSTKLIIDRAGEIAGELITRERDELAALYETKDESNE